MPGEIPQSDALSEASTSSLNELFNADPEGYGERDVERIIEALREHRARFEAAEAAGKRAPRPPKGGLGAKGPAQLSSDKSADDLGL